MPFQTPSTTTGSPADSRPIIPLAFSHNSSCQEPSLRGRGSVFEDPDRHGPGEPGPKHPASRPGFPDNQAHGAGHSKEDPPYRIGIGHRPLNPLRSTSVDRGVGRMEVGTPDAEVITRWGKEIDQPPFWNGNPNKSG